MASFYPNLSILVEKMKKQDLSPKIIIMLFRRDVMNPVGFKKTSEIEDAEYLLAHLTIAKTNNSYFINNYRELENFVVE